MKKLLAFTLTVLMLLPLIACGNKEESADSSVVYVMTQASYYTKDGICWKQYNYTYDAAAQNLGVEVKMAEQKKEYNSVLDCYVYSYDGDSPMRVYATVQREYDEHGNVTVHSDPKYALTAINGSYAWNYSGIKPEDYEFTYANSTVSSAPTCFEYDKAGNITRIYAKTEEYEQDLFLFEYDKNGRLTKEIIAQITGDVFEKNYAYENGRLTSVQTRVGQYIGMDSDQWDDNLQVQFTWKLEYVGNLLSSITCYDRNDVKREVRRFSYDSKGNLAKTEATYSYDNDQVTETKTYTCDAHGNVVKAVSDDGSWVEYTYKAMEVTNQQAVNYRRRMGFDNGDYYHTGSVFMSIRYDYAYCHLIPNPLCDLSYLLELRSN